MTYPTGHVLLLAPLPVEAITAQLDGVEVIAATTRQAALAAAPGAAVCVTSWDGNAVVVDAELAALLAPTCKLVQTPSAGLDGLDVAAVQAAGIPIGSAAGLNAVAVAEWTVWAAIDALRGLSDAHTALAGGEWLMFGRMRRELRGRTVGIIGMGDVARALLPRLAGFEVEVGYWSRSRHADVEDAGVTRHELDALIARSEVLVLAVALTDQTRGLLSAQRLATMPPHAVVINVARGEIWDEAAIADAVASGQLLGAATDVFCEEPAPQTNPLVGAAGIVTTPHIAGPTAEVVGAIFGRVLHNVTAIYQGGELHGIRAG